MKKGKMNIKILLTSLNCPTAQIKLQSCQPVWYFSDIIFVSAHMSWEILYAMRYYIKSGYSLRRLMTFNYLRLEDQKTKIFFFWLWSCVNVRLIKVDLSIYQKQ